MEPTGPADSDVPYDAIIELLRDAAGADAAWAAALGPATRLDGDLFLDSLSVSAFAELLRARYGEEVDLLGYIATLDIDQIIELSVSEVADYVTTTRLAPASLG